MNEEGTSENKEEIAFFAICAFGYPEQHNIVSRALRRHSVNDKMRR